MALNGELQANHLGQNRGVTSRAERHLAGGDETAVGVHADHPIALEVKAGDLAVLNQVDPHLIGLAGERPGDVVMLGDPTTTLQGRAHHGVAHIR